MALLRDEINPTLTPHVGSVTTENDRKFATVMIEDPRWKYRNDGQLRAPPTFCAVVRNPKQWFVYRDGQVMMYKYVTDVPKQCATCHIGITFARDVYLDANDQRPWANCCIACSALHCDACFGARSSLNCPRCRLRAPQLPPAS